MTKKLLSLFIALLGLLGWSVPAVAIAWDGEKLVTGNSYYLYNVGTEKFLNQSGISDTPTDLWYFGNDKDGSYIRAQINGTYWYIYIEKKATYRTAEIRQTIAHPTIAESTTLDKDKGTPGAYKFYHVRNSGVGQGTAFFGIDGEDIDGKQTNDNTSDWYLISESQYDEAMRNFYFDLKVINKTPKLGTFTISDNYTSKVHVDNDVNSVSQQVTLTATPEDGVLFLGWASDLNGENIDIPNQTHSITITSTSHDPENPAKFFYYPIFKKAVDGITTLTSDKYYVYNVGAYEYMKKNGENVTVEETNSRILFDLVQSEGNWKFGTGDGTFMTYNAPNIVVNGDGTNNATYTLTQVTAGSDRYYIQIAGTSNYLVRQGNSVVVSTNNSSYDAIWKFVPSKKIRFVSYNVDGLPKTTPLVNIPINNNCPEENGTRMMGQKLIALDADVIAVQEDFNYNDALYEGLGGTSGKYIQGTHRGSFSWSDLDLRRRQIKTDGLNMFWKNGLVDNEIWTEWATRNGDLSGGFDENLLKGYRYYRFTGEDMEGNPTYIDVFNLHMDADSDQKDINARNAELKQLAEFINKLDNNRPKIIMGDFNSRYTREKIEELLINGVTSGNKYSIKDAWVETYRSRSNPKYPAYTEPWNSNNDLTGEYNTANCEVVDKIFIVNPVIGDNHVNLELVSFRIATEFNYDSDVQDANGNVIANQGDMMGDHYPVVAEFEITGQYINEDVDWIWEGETINTDKVRDSTARDYYIYNDKYKVNGYYGSFLKGTATGYQAVTKSDDTDNVDNATLFTFTKGTYRGPYDGSILQTVAIENISYYANGTKFYIGHDNGRTNTGDKQNWKLNPQDETDYYNFRSGFGNYTSQRFRYLNIYGEEGGINFPDRAGVNEANASEWWKLISPAQMNYYRDYKAAITKAKQYLESNYKAAVPEIEEALRSEVLFATNRSWKSPEVKKFIELVNSLDIANMTVSSAAEYGTFVAPYTVKLPANVEAYVVSVQDGTALLAQAERQDSIPALTPVLLYAKGGFENTDFYGRSLRKNMMYKTNGDANKDNTFEKKIVDDTDVVPATNEDNHLIGSLKKQQIPDSYIETGLSYLLQKKNDKLKFYLCNPKWITTNTEYTGEYYLIGKNRCWLQAPSKISTKQIKAFVLFPEDNDYDAIESVNEKNQDNAIYDLQGRRVNATQRGIYIINGKKVFINE